MTDDDVLLPAGRVAQRLGISTQTLPGWSSVSSLPAATAATGPQPWRLCFVLWRTGMAPTPFQKPLKMERSKAGIARLPNPNQSPGETLVLHIDP
jgi:hypothetical protein